MRSIRLWSDPIALEVASDQTEVRSKRLWSDPIALEVASYQTIVRSKRLWSDPIALDVASDQTQVRSNPPMIRLFRPKWHLIRPSPDHGPDRSALELPKRHCNFGLGTPTARKCKAVYLFGYLKSSAKNQVTKNWSHHNWKPLSTSFLLRYKNKCKNLANTFSMKANQ